MSVAPTSRISIDHPSPERPALVRHVHTDYGELGIPFYDEELDVAQGVPHGYVTRILGMDLQRVAERGGFKVFADNPVWYWDWRYNKQKAFFSDLALLKPSPDEREIADDVLLAVEVVTTTHQKKMEKDTKFQKELNECNGVPEFVLYYPDMSDARSLVWFRLVNRKYVEIEPNQDCFECQSIPGLVFKILPRTRWSPGRKVEVSYKGVLLRDPEEEFRMRLELERERTAAREETEALKQALEAERKARMELERRLAELKNQQS
ncbi:MAG: Uma2 family endonuclease [Acidobacteriota bacterium]|nr:Uma2 family endonuclease [Acidobacteriota bacterium]